MAGTSTNIDFTVGSRRLFGVTRKLETVSHSLEDILTGRTPPVPPLDGIDGYRILSLPQHRIAALRAEFPDHIMGAQQEYRRHYIDMGHSYADYLAQFSGKTRSTLRRKQKRFAKENGGALQVSKHRTAQQVEAFLDLALPLSAKTYQAELLDAGLPDNASARQEMLELAEADKMRCFLLYLHGQPAAYLALPVEGDTLIYAYLGYDPGIARLSPGTVLQMAALESLFAEGRYRYFDFTEGEGPHKAMFGTDSALCCSFVLLRDTLANRALLGARDGFDGIVAVSKNLAQRSGMLGNIRKALRA